jgi:hypothetical protein
MVQKLAAAELVKRSLGSYFQEDLESVVLNCVGSQFEFKLNLLNMSLAHL